MADPHRYEKREEPKDEGPMLAPRAHQKKVALGKYKDRAAMRREGVDDEYKPVSGPSLPKRKLTRIR